MTLTSATFDMAVQGVSLVYAQNAGPSVTVSFAAGTVANAGHVFVVDNASPAPGQNVTWIGVETIRFPSQPSDEAGPGAGSTLAVHPQPPDIALDTAGATGHPLPAANLAPVQTAGVPTAAAPALINPSIALTPPSQALDLQSAAFRISRMPTDASPLEVAFVQAAYGPAGVVAHEGTASFDPGSAHVDVPVAWALESPADPCEIVTLTLRSVDASRYRVAQPTATLFLVDANRGCSETALFEAFRCGQSTEAFNALFQLHRSAVCRTCFGLLRNLADAEDVTQIVFLMLARQQLRIGINIAGWLRTVARHASIGLLRSRARRSRHETKVAKAEHIQGEDEAIDLRDELEVALAQLAPDLRDAVRLRYLEGWSQQEAAERLGCPRGTLSQRAARGIQILRAILGFRAD
jgi:RNA polymerase sigma factor (sigma-70 family)